MRDVAFLGAGLLSSGMVEAMLKRGRRVTVWNRTEAKARALEPFGATVAETPQAAVSAADEIHVVLSDDAAVDELLPLIVGALTPNAIVIDHTTTSPAGTKVRVHDANTGGIRFLHAPVFMSPQMCRDAVGVMMVAGPAAVFDEVKDSLQAMTGDVWYVGEQGDRAAACKIFGNSMIFVLTSGIADVFAMADAVGVSRQDAAAVFTRFKVGNIIPVRAEKMAKHDLTASFELTMARKDLRLMLEAGGADNLALLPVIARQMDEAIAAGHGKDDLGAIACSSENPLTTAAQACRLLRITSLPCSERR